MEQQEARDLCEELIHDLEHHEAVAIISIIDDLDFSLLMHEANAAELQSAIARNVDPARQPRLFDREGHKAYQQELAITTRHLANYAASACVVVDRVEALAAYDDCPSALRPKLKKCLHDVKKEKVIAFVRLVRDGHIHFVPQHVSAIMGAGGQILLEPRWSAGRSAPKAAVEYIESAGYHGVPLAQARADADAALRRFVEVATAAIRAHFADVLADRDRIEAEADRLYKIGFPNHATT